MKKDKSRDTADDPLRDTGDESPVAADADPGAAHEELAAASSESVTPAPKSVLPAFGFAADLLRKSASTAESDSASSTPTDGGLDPGGLDADSLDGAALDAGSLDPTAPNRVFDFADRLTRGSGQQAEAAQAVRLGTFVTFDLAGERFAIPVDPVRQVVRVSAITRVPHAPRPIRGVTNLRGRVIPVIDLRLRIGLTEGAIDRSTRVISVASKGRLIGLLVDAVHQVTHLDLNRVQPPPDDVMTVQSDYIEGVYGEGSDLLMLLDIDRALTIKDAA